MAYLKNFSISALLPSSALSNTALKGKLENNCWWQLWKEFCLTVAPRGDLNSISKAATLVLYWYENVGAGSALVRMDWGALILTAEPAPNPVGFNLSPFRSMEILSSSCIFLFFRWKNLTSLAPDWELYPPSKLMTPCSPIFANESRFSS